MSKRVLDPDYADVEDVDASDEEETVNIATNKRRKSPFHFGGHIISDQKAVTDLWIEKVGSEQKGIEDAATAKIIASEIFNIVDKSTSAIVSVIIEIFCLPEIVEFFMKIRGFWMEYTEEVYRFKADNADKQLPKLRTKSATKVKEDMSNCMAVLLLSRLWFDFKFENTFSKVDKQGLPVNDLDRRNIKGTLMKASVAVLRSLYYTRQTTLKKGGTKVPDVLISCVLSGLARTDAYKDIVPESFLCDRSWNADSWSNRQHYLTRIKNGLQLWQRFPRTTLEDFVKQAKSSVDKVIATLATAGTGQVSTSRISGLIIIFAMTEFNDESYNEALLMTNACGHDRICLTNVVPGDIRAKGVRLTETQVDAGHTRENASVTLAEEKEDSAEEDLVVHDLTEDVDLATRVLYLENDIASLKSSMKETLKILRDLSKRN